MRYSCGKGGEKRKTIDMHNTKHTFLLFEDGFYPKSVLILHSLVLTHTHTLYIIMHGLMRCRHYISTTAFSVKPSGEATNIRISGKSRSPVILADSTS